MADESPILVTILFKRTPDFEFNMEHYKTKHLDLAQKTWETYGVKDGKVLEMIDANSEYVVGAQMEFPNLATWEAAQKDEGCKAVHKDSAENVTKEKAIWVVSKVVATCS